MAHYKLKAIPKMNLSISILREFMTDKELKELIKKYMLAKKTKYIKDLEAQIKKIERW